MMRRHLLIAASALTLSTFSTFSVGAQETRAALLRQATAALEDFNQSSALDFARTSLDPSLGVPDSAWSQSVHMITLILIERGDESLARTWARWAMRMNPLMVVDTSVNTTAAVKANLLSARDSAGKRSTDDDVTRTAWTWATRGSSETQGRIRLDPTTMPVPVNVVVRGVGMLPAGQGLALAPGTYEIEVAAPGYLQARVWREVLPGTTLTLSFQLNSAAVVSGTLSEAMRTRVYSGTAVLSTSRSGGPPTCSAGVLAGGQLVLTSYTAIRGAEFLSVSIGSDAKLTASVRVAAYDAAANLAVLTVPSPRIDTVPIAGSVIDGQAVWGIGLADCTSPSSSRSVIAEWTQRPLGALRLAETFVQGLPGSPIVDYLGRLTGVWTDGTTAVPATRALPLLDQARANIAARTTLAVADVARLENHLYGSLSITSDVRGTTARVTPLENWHWAPLATAAPTPFAFSGPMGRYRVEFLGAGLPSRTQEVTIRYGEATTVADVQKTVAQSPPPTAAQPSIKKRGVPKWVWFAVLGGGAAAVALGGSSAPTTGSAIIDITVP